MSASVVPSARPSRETGSHHTSTRIGTRGSALALTQTRFVAELLARRYPGGDFPIVKIRTEGDRDKTSPLSVIGGRGVFTSALEAALLAGEIDVAVHSAKDLPSTLPPGLTIAAFPAREDPRDVLVSRHGVPLDQLPSDPVIGTSSRRRAFQLKRLRPDARVVELRGNLDTRLRKALEGELDGVILAAAGIARMGWSDRITEYLPVERFLPAPGQGALAIETRIAPDPATVIVTAINDERLAMAVATERAFLRGVGAGCTSPVGAFAEVAPGGDEISLTAILASDDGARFERVQESFPVGDAADRAQELGRRLLAAVSRRAVAPELDQVPLAGARVLVTASGAPGERLIAALRDAGAEPVALPMIRVVPTSQPDGLRQAAKRLANGDYDWLVVTSGNAVVPFVAAMPAGATHPAPVHVAAVGEATARRLREAGFRVDLIPAAQTAVGLVEALRDSNMAGRRVLCPLGNLARPTLADGLRDLGAKVDVVEAYRTEPVEAMPDELRGRFQRGEVDVITFASPSAVENFAHLCEGAHLRGEQLVVACIGPTTRDAAALHGFLNVVVADDPSTEAQVASIAEHLTVNAGGGAK